MNYKIVNYKIVKTIGHCCSRHEVRYYRAGVGQGGGVGQGAGVGQGGGVPTHRWKENL